MNSEASQPLPYRGAMLRWAREWRGRSVEDAAQRIGVDLERIIAWEADEEGDSPTVRQARTLADFYGREFLEFFYDTPPEIKESGLLPDFRVGGRSTDPHERREILHVQHWAEAQRLNALELYEDIEEEPPALPAELIATVDDDVENIAVTARKSLRFPIEEQRRLTSKEQQKLPDLLRQRMESVGILVLRQSNLASWGVSGLCIAAFPLPIIVYTAETSGRQAFTLCHEFGHIILRQSAISGQEPINDTSSFDKKVEQWCNRFASAFLIPKVALAELRLLPPKPAPKIDDSTLATLARVFRVSQHAMLIRLVDLGYVDAGYYWDVKLPHFRAQESAFKRKGRSLYWASRIVNSLGGLYTKLVLEAWGSGRVPFHQAADYLGLKNPAHLNKIRQELGNT